MANSSELRVIDLEPRQEFIIKVGEEAVKMVLRRGLAEVYGTEMLANKEYTFKRNSKAAIYTYQGATLEMAGSPMKSHISKNCDYMIRYLALHRDLENMRHEAEKLSEQIDFTATNTDNPDSLKPDLNKSPICLICEPMDAKNVGKSTLCRILLNYAARRGRAPIFIDLDPDQNLIGLPGTVGALSIESPIDIESGLQLRSSMLMHFGHTSPSANTENKSNLYYKAIIENMAKVIHARLTKDKKSFYSGVIINSSSWTDNSEYMLLVDACKAFNANTVVVVDDEVLQDDLKSDLKKGGRSLVTVVNVPKTLEIQKSRATEQFELRCNKIREYFYGTEYELYHPHTSEVKFAFLKRLIYRIENSLMLHDSMLPLGRKAQDNQVKASHYECKPSDLLHRLLAISYSKIADVVANPSCVVSTNIMGFICVTSCRGDVVSILTPQRLPNPMDQVLLYSDIEYMDWQ